MCIRNSPVASEFSFIDIRNRKKQKCIVSFDIQYSSPRLPISAVTHFKEITHVEILSFQSTFNAPEYSDEVKKQVKDFRKNVAEHSLEELVKVCVQRVG